MVMGRGDRMCFQGAAAGVAEDSGGAAVTEAWATAVAGEAAAAAVEVDGVAAAAAAVWEEMERAGELEEAMEEVGWEGVEEMVAAGVVGMETAAEVVGEEDLEAAGWVAGAEEVLAGWVAEGWEAADCRTDTPPSHLHRTREPKGKELEVTHLQG